MTNEAAFPLSHAATPHGSAQPPCEGSAKAVSIGDTTSSFVSGFRPSVGLATIVSNRHKHKQKTFMLIPRTFMLLKPAPRPRVLSLRLSLSPPRVLARQHKSASTCILASPPRRGSYHAQNTSSDQRAPQKEAYVDNYTSNLARVYVTRECRVNISTGVLSP